MWFDMNCFCWIGLKQTCGREQSNADFGSIVGGHFDESELSHGIVNGLHDGPIAFNWEAFCNSLEFCDCAGRLEFANKVVSIRGDRKAGA